MELCRACGEHSDGNLSESLQKYSDIYFNLTSIELTPEEDPKRQRICNECYLKLLEYNRFRTVCLQVHYKLTEIKTEIHPDQQDFATGNELGDVKTERDYTAGDDLPDADAFEESLYDKEKELPEHELFTCEMITPSNDDDGGSSGSEKLVKPKLKRKRKSSNSDEEKPKTQTKRKRKPRVKKTEEEKKAMISYDCEKCEKKFISEMQFQGHMRTHEGLKAFPCTHCDKDFTDYRNLRRHVAYKHTGEGGDEEMKFACDFPGCESVYSTKHGMTSHKKKHDPNYVFVAPEPRKRICDQCGKTFNTNANLKKHSYTHTPSDMPFQCTICNKKYPTKNKLKEHYMRHEGIKNHVCTVCGLKKTTRDELKRHMNYHTLEVQHTCHVCAQVFNTLGNMQRHIKVVHQGIKEFPCTHCDRTFGKAETLKNHIMTHTGEKPYECEVCGSRFIQSVALQKHMKTHRKYAQPQQLQSSG